MTIRSYTIGLKNDYLKHLTVIKYQFFKSIPLIDGLKMFRFVSITEFDPFFIHILVTNIPDVVSSKLVSHDLPSVLLVV